MALDCGPDSGVCVPGAMDRAESSDVANVRVTWGRDAVGAAAEGRKGTSQARSEGGKCNVSRVVIVAAAAADWRGWVRVGS